MWIKVCGCIDPQNAAEVSACGIDAVGINFYRQSKRFVADRGAEVRDALRPEVEAIGLFVDETVDNIIETYDRLGLDAIQLHGHEPLDIVAALAPRPVFRAIRVSNGAIATSIQTVVDAIGDQPNLAGILVDAASSKGLGGTGESIDWRELATAKSPTWPRLILAGGLSPANVGEAIDVAKPDGVDVASGVESKPGWKDIDLVQQFVNAAS